MRKIRKFEFKNWNGSEFIGSNRLLQAKALQARSGANGKLYKPEREVKFPFRIFTEYCASLRFELFLGHEI
jgi:hypothetical protein